MTWVRIRIRIDPHSFLKVDPDPYKVNADPKHCSKPVTQLYTVFITENYVFHSNVADLWSRNILSAWEKI
jgi:hypothetical protein